MCSAKCRIVLFIVGTVLFVCSCNRTKENTAGSESTQPPVHRARAKGLRVPTNLSEISSVANVRATKLLSSATKTTKNPSIKSTFQHPDYCDPSVEAFDFRSATMVTPVKDQGECGACWAFATNAVLESSYLGLRKEHIDASEQDLISCSPAGQFGDRNCSGGWWAFDVLEKPGIESTVRYPYAASDSECKSQPPIEFRAFISGYVLQGNGATSIPPNAALKGAMCKHGPLAVGFVATPTFTDFGWNHHSPSDLFAESDSGDVDHGVELIGWDKDGWIIKNSWGSQWGDQGFLRVKYGTNRIGLGAAWAEAWPKDYDPPQQVRALIEKPAAAPKMR
jgi:C1A family cysteine protease